MTAKEMAKMIFPTEVYKTKYAHSDIFRDIFLPVCIKNTQKIHKKQK